MQWSRLKKMIESRFCDALAGRIQIHTTRYTKDEEIGRFWIAFDGQTIFSAHDAPGAGSLGWLVKESSEAATPSCVYWNRINGRYACEYSLKVYLNSSIEEAIETSDPIMRALALLDKRVGKRRLISFVPTEEDAPIVKHFYMLRCAVEGLNPPFAAS